MNYNSAWCLFHSSDVLLRELMLNQKTKGALHTHDS